ncbi:MAG TPA: hypothetical protein VG501_02430 [Rhizomicrobium sp.]|nr:hypothetical protein [Rhizomicrobium sp.]
MPKVPDDNSNAALQKRQALTRIFKGVAPKEPARAAGAAPAPKSRKTAKK